ncbi:MAG TPA: nuclear transport factor 2 family protein [Phycisphaerae bacterium]|nr:nuclear transport factor 2 family protein [Phycisphaerae bacterium]
MKRKLAVLTTSALAISALVLCLGMNGPTDDEKAAVKRAVLDYCEAAYEMKPELLERSVHPEVNKFGFHRRSPDEEYRMIPMTYPQLVELVKVWNQDGKFGPDAPKEVIVFDVLDKTASAKLVGAWGIDYMHLAKYDGKWKIVQVLWQSHPQPSE